MSSSTKDAPADWTSVGNRREQAGGGREVLGGALGPAAGHADRADHGDRAVYTDQADRAVSTDQADPGGYTDQAEWAPRGVRAAHAARAGAVAPGGSSGPRTRPRPPVIAAALAARLVRRMAGGPR